MRRNCKQPLPCENVTVLVEGKKLIRDLRKAVRYCMRWGRSRPEITRNHLISNEGWLSKKMNEIDRGRFHNVTGQLQEATGGGCPNKTLDTVAHKPRLATTTTLTT